MPRRSSRIAKRRACTTRGGAGEALGPRPAVLPTKEFERLLGLYGAGQAGVDVAAP